MIVEFYTNSEIFITGGSGVVGKAAIEKLLRSGNVKRIFVLMRCKRGVSSEARLEDLKKSRIFRVLRETKPNELNKLVVIPGDISQEGLGISPENRNLMKNVSVFLHSAASTRFDEPIRSAIRLNLKSTQEALKLAKTMKSLKIFLHVSTYFSNPYLKFIEDKLYPAKFDWRTAIKLLELDEGDPTLDIITRKVITQFTNTYLFTKHLAEHLVNDYRFELPVAIYKPSIVITSIDEPEPGFTETMNGIMGVMVGWGTGLIQTFWFKDTDMKLDMTPLDFGTKTLLIFTAMKAQQPQEKILDTCAIGKFSSYLLLKTPFIGCCDFLTDAYHKYPLEKSFWIPNVTVTTSSYYYWTLVVFLQIIPAMFMDVLLWIFRVKPFMMHIQRRAHVTRQVLLFFMENKYASDGITDLHEMHHYAEGTEFDISYLVEYPDTEVEARLIIEKIAKGCRKFVLNEPDSSIPQCKKILKAKYIAYNVVRGIVTFFVGKAVYRRVLNYLNEDV